MTARSWVAALEETLEDARLSRGERKSLREVLNEVTSSPAGASVVRARAFDLAGEALSGKDPAAVLGWLEAVMRVLAGTATHATPVADESEAYFSPGTECLSAILRELQRARRTVDVCVFTITDNRISDAILSIARRGIALRVIGDADKATDRGSDLTAFEAAGIPVRLDRSAGHMHHKFMLVDGARLLTGSYNWTRSAERTNRENILVTTNTGLVARYAQEFDALWVSDRDLA